MASRRPIKLSDLGMSKEEYQELRYFCLQYAQKKREAARAEGARRARLLRDVAIIESAARRAGDDLAPWILRAVTSGGGVQAAFARDRPPVGERQFYEIRRRFFGVLREMKG